MRTTLDLDDDVLSVVRDLARCKKQSLGATASELIRRGLVPETAPVVKMRKGIPVWVHGPGAIPVTSEFVRSLLEEE